MKISVTGYNGRIGKLLVKSGCFPLVCDITKPEEIDRAIKKDNPSIVVHLASLSDVDFCEEEKNRDKVLQVNYKGTLNLADACHTAKVGMVFLSTDHIFDGKKGPYKEDYPYYSRNLLGQYQHPMNYYGLSKLTAEAIQKIYPFKIVRTSYNFDKARLIHQLNLMKNEVSMEPPAFMNRSFMYIPHFVSVLQEYLDRFYEMPPILHLSGSQTVSWYEFLLAVASIYGYSKHPILPRKKDAKDLFAPRPHKAGLNTSLSKKLGFPQFSYIDGIRQMYQDD